MRHPFVDWIPMIFDFSTCLSTRKAATGVFSEPKRILAGFGMFSLVTNPTLFLLQGPPATPAVRRQSASQSLRKLTGNSRTRTGKQVAMFGSTEEGIGPMKLRRLIWLSP